MFKDSPDGQTHCYTPEEEMRMAFARDTQGNDYDYTHSGHPGHGYDDAPTQDAYVGYQAALASQSEQVRKLEEEKAALQGSLNSMAETDVKLGNSLSAAHDRELALQAVIEQKDEAIKWYLDSCRKELVTHEFLVKHFSKALALTPESALKNHYVAEKSENGLEWKFANTLLDLPVGTKLYAVKP